jgi:alkylation response protein AidB-like acyl-CoA dehydrogenase
VLHDLEGTSTAAVPAAPALGTRLAPFVTDLARQGEEGPSGPGEVELLCTLWASYLLGVSEYALELAVAHVSDRVQFGRPLAGLQSVRFQIADATVAVDGLRELIRFTLWRIATDPLRSRADALAARLSAHDVAQPTLRLSQQLHGAAGLCDEYDISVLVRHVQPALRLPVDSDALSDLFF